jgi:tetratricopeptide (TPR) repeat protein
MVYSQKTVNVFDVDSVLRTINPPNEKVDFILKFLDEPENIYLDNAEDLAKRAFEISQNKNYAFGKVNSMILLAKYYFRKSNYKMAMDYSQKAREMSEDFNFYKELAKSLSLIGAIYTDFSDFDNSSRYFFKSLKIFERLNDKKGISNSFGNIGMNFFNQGDYKKALEYYNQALLFAKQSDNQTAIKKELNNIAALYSNIGKYDTAIILFKEALEININLGDRLGQGTNIMNIGYIQMNRGNNQDALLNFQQALDLATELQNVRHISECNVNFGYCYYTINKIEESIEHFKKALIDGQKIRNYRIISPVANMLNKIYTEKKDTIQAYKYLMIEKIANDSLYYSQNQKQLSKLELKYLFEKQESERQQEQRAKNVLIFIIIFSLILGLIILGLLLSRHRLKSKLVLTEKEKIESELINKDRELTVNLISLIKKNEMLTEISHKLVLMGQNTKGTEAKEIITQLSKQLINLTNDKMLNEFSIRFQEVHAGFYEKLLKDYPDLTQNELKLCAFLRLNMSTKEIAELTGQELNSIAKARQRLRKKLKISGSDTNLVILLSQK